MQRHPHGDCDERTGNAPEPTPEQLCPIDAIQWLMAEHRAVSSLGAEAAERKDELTAEAAPT